MDLIVQFCRTVSDSLGETVAGGYVLALALVCLLQYLVHIHRHRQTSRERQRGRQETEFLAGELQESQRELSILRLENRLLQDISSNTEPGKVFDLVLRRFAPRVQEDFCVLVIPESTGPLILQSRGLSEKSLRNLKIDEELLQQIHRERVVVLERVRLYESRLMADLAPDDRKKTQRVFLLAVGKSNDFLGVILTTSLYPSGIPRERQMEFARRMMQSLSGSLKHTRALKIQQNELRTTSEMLELRKIADRKFSNPLLMIEQFLRRLAEQIRVERTALYLATPDAVMLNKILVRTGNSLQANVLKRWHENEDVLAEIGAIQAKPLFFDSLDLSDLGIETLMRRAFVAPLVQDGQTLGVLILADSRNEPLREAEFQLAAWATEFLAETIHRVLSHAAIERQARQDELTRLANRRTFDRTIRDYLEAAKQEGTCCSLLLLDLDRFKSINDTYGHQTGDEVLRTSAKILREQVQDLLSKERALVARYGGEEMAMLLKGIDVAETIRIGEAIRAAVESSEHFFNGRNLRITVSIGAAAYPDHAECVEDLIAAADKALYKAKQSGRNRLICIN